MGRVKSKSIKKDNTKRNIVVAVVVAVILVVVVLMASNPHPGYSQLEKELDQITLPEGWSEVGPRTGEKDYWNMFCSDVTIKCPSISTTVTANMNSQALKEFTTFSEKNGYTVVESSPECLPFDNFNGSRCYVRSLKEKNTLSITLNDGSANSNYEVGISLRKSSED